MKLRLLPNTIDGLAVTGRQHFTCFVIDDLVAVDAGCLANSTTETEKDKIRDVVLTHAHLDHIAGLPLFIDDLFDTLESPVRVHASSEVVNILENDIFNWRVYPRFSELTNRFGPVMEYREIEPAKPFEIGHLSFEAVEVNHKVPSVGFLISDGMSVIALTGDTAEMDHFWRKVNSLEKLDGLLIECAFPNRMKELAEVSHHLTPSLLRSELEKFDIDDCPVLAINLKPMYRTETARELEELKFQSLRTLIVGEEYEF
ncbi:MAG: 3',5'-cyclic-nucleotide phosphodiesterase [Acidobacteria bacterium]|nr:MAG: 3',5'-cyclic-nucleotide phosphodiesterase [Acidobacteriota bacterium]REK01281.1 MAG: 3',5'-cyclic-nucleotide phosphodiesterase [Acidobacteriota bacterium]REK14237.1 MAG: 3',5'-cyclic-nucleotide phosphodiesterase [Acidobacteriota bacterium]REK44952.1 MAG: 3',5'-cyclic-nucleotide phosphodiesterase [Acidobacteriota bacterium]